MDATLFQKIRKALELSWSAETSACFSPTAYPSYGQCAQTAVVIQEIFGGEILRTTGWHGHGTTSTTESVNKELTSLLTSFRCQTIHMR
jgi:hypothetical protein